MINNVDYGCNKKRGRNKNVFFKNGHLIVDETINTFTTGRNKK